MSGPYSGLPLWSTAEFRLRDPVSPDYLFESEEHLQKLLRLSEEQANMISTPRIRQNPRFNKQRSRFRILAFPDR